MKKVIPMAAVILIGSGSMIACHSSHRLTNNQEQMFTAEQINEKLAKVRTGADFPDYIREIKALGVLSYETFVTDGRSVYYGANDCKTAWPAKYEPLVISDTCTVSRFQFDLKAHQQGETDYLTFIAMCARSGIEKWIVSLEQMTCTYYDKTGNEVLVEEIPQ